MHYHENEIYQKCNKNDHIGLCVELKLNLIHSNLRKAYKSFRCPPLYLIFMKLQFNDFYAG